MVEDREQRWSFFPYLAPLFSGDGEKDSPNVMPHRTTMSQMTVTTKEDYLFVQPHFSFLTSVRSSFVIPNHVSVEGSEEGGNNHRVT